MNLYAGFLLSLIFFAAVHESAAVHEAGVFGAAASQSVCWGFKRPDQQLEYDPVRDPVDHAGPLRSAIRCGVR